MDRRFIIGIIFILVVAIANKLNGQIKFSFTPSAKHAQKLSKIEDGKKKLDAYYKYKSKAEKKHQKHYLDSINRLPKSSLLDSSKLAFITLPDSASAKDSLTWALNTLAHNKQYDEINQFLDQYPFDSLGLNQLDTAALSPEIESRLTSALSSKLNLPNQESPFSGLDEFKKGPPGGSLDFNRDPKEQIDELQSKVQADQMAKAQVQMQAMKKKYISMPDLNNPDSGIKRNSLEGKPLIDRIYLGGNVSVVSTAPFALDVDVQLGYRINRQFVLGTGVVWREAFYSKKDSLIAQPKAAHGYSGFGRYKFGKGFFAFAEYSSIKNKPLFHETDIPQVWQNQYLLGVGRQFNITGYLKMNTTILYDFNYRHNDLHPRPFIVRVGYTLKKPGFKKNN